MMQIFKRFQVKSKQSTATPTTTYTIKSGDTLWAISTRLGVVYEELLEANPLITNPELVYAGQVINIPSSKDTATITSQHQDSNTQSTTTYTIRSGDTLWAISTRLGVVYKELLEVNPLITNPDLVYAGQVINVPVMV